MIMRLREPIIAFKNKGKRLSYGREIKYHRSRAKYPVLDRNMVSGGFAPHMLDKHIFRGVWGGTPQEERDS